MKTPSFVWMITAGCVLVFLLALNSYLTFINIAQLNKDSYWVEHTYQVLNGLDRVVSTLTEAESSGRACLITGDDQFLDQYHSRAEVVNSRISQIESQTSDNAPQQARIPEIRRLATERLQVLNEAVEARRTRGPEEVSRLIGSGRGKVAMDNLTNAIGQMQDAERELLDQRARRSRQTYWTTIVTVIAAGVVAIAAVLGFLILLRRFLRARTEAAFVIAEQAERLRTTLASIGDAVITTDTEGRIANMNLIAESLTGWSTAEASDRPLEEVFRIVNETTREGVESPVTKSLRQGSIVGIANHTVLLTKDGSEVPIDDSAAPIRCKEGDVVGCVLVFRDVSERRRNEARTREMHSRLSSTLAFGEIGTWEFDLVNNLVTADPNLARLFHLSEAEAEGTGLESYLRSIHPEDVGAVRESIETAISQSDRYDVEYRILDGQNNVRWVMARGRIERDESGQAVRLPGVVIDTTRSRQAEEDVERLVSVSERERRLFNTALSNTADFVYTFDLDGKFTYINQALLDLLQKTSAEAVGKNFFELNYPTELAQRLQDQIQRVIETSAPVKDETPYTSHKGERQYEYIFVPVIDSSGAIEAVAGSTRDITDRKETEIGLRESEKRLRQLADAMPQIVWAAKPDGTLDYYNWRWYEYINLSPDRFEEARWDLHIHSNDLPRAREKWTESISTGVPYGVEFRVKDHAGNYRWFLARALSVRNDEGEIVRWYGTCTDINEEVERENELRNIASRLSDADRRKNEFLAMLAHELRNPLAPIRNALQIIRLIGGERKDLHAATTMMDRQVGQLVRLVDDLLDISRISSGKIELRKEHVDLKRVISTAVEAARPEFERKNVRLDVEVSNQPIYMHGDPARLAQTIGNLLNNAVKFTDRGGGVTVETTIADGKVVVRIKDDGIGIAADQLPYIFDLFVQVDTSLERSTSGLGIGLSLVKKLVEMHDGTVEPKSEGPGHGTEFILELPLLVDEGDQKAIGGDAATELTAKAQRRVLVVDDNADSAESLKLLLEIAGHEVTIARDGIEALETAESFRPEVVLLDIGLPRLNGYEAAREMRKKTWGAAMTLIALTGWGQKEDRERSKKAGFDRHMVKPVDYVELLEFLDNHGDH